MFHVLKVWRLLTLIHMTVILGVLEGAEQAHLTPPHTLKKSIMQYPHSYCSGYIPQRELMKFITL